MQSLVAVAAPSSFLAGLRDAGSLMRLVGMLVKYYNAQR